MAVFARVAFFPVLRAGDFFATALRGAAFAAGGLRFGTGLAGAGFFAAAFFTGAGGYNATFAISAIRAKGAGAGLVGAASPRR